MDETIGLGFHSHRDAITGVTSSTAAVPAASSISQHHATTKFVSSSADSKRMSMLFPPPPPHPSTAVQQPIQLNDNRNPSLQIRQQQQQLPLSTSSTLQPNDMHQNINFTNHPPTSSSFQPPPGLPPPLSIPAAITVPPLQLPPPPIPIQQQSSQMEQQQQQQNDSIAKARAIAQRFHTQSNTQPPSYISSINNQHSNSVNINDDNNNDNTNVNNNNNNYAQKRQQHFRNEQLKLQTYTLKNLDYILKHDETQLRSHVECMNEMTEWGEQQGLQLQLLKQQQLEREQKREQQKQQRQQREVEQKSGGGIGSKDQRYLERIKRRRQLDTTATGANPQQQQQQQRTSIYLTNLPTDGSITERTLRSLFCVYGHLDRVTMYRNRSTGELKGDGLIVFGVDDATINLGGNESGNNVQVLTTNGRDLIETVCMQMNGAELPCGTVIGVEPADMDWGSRGKDEKCKKMDHCVQQQQQGTASSGEGDVVMQSKEASMKGDDDDEEEEDLDDFFASLE